MQDTAEEYHRQKLANLEFGECQEIILIICFGEKNFVKTSSEVKPL